MAKAKDDKPVTLSVAPLGRFPVPDMIKAGIAKFNKPRTKENEEAKPDEWAAGQASFDISTDDLYTLHLEHALKVLGDADRKRAEKITFSLPDVPPPPYVVEGDPEAIHAKKDAARRAAEKVLADMDPADRKLREKILEGIRVNAQTNLVALVGRGVHFVLSQDFRWRL